MAETPSSWAWIRLIIEASFERAAATAVMPGTVIAREDFLAFAGTAYDKARERLRVLTEQAERAGIGKPAPPTPDTTGGR